MNAFEQSFAGTERMVRWVERSTDRDPKEFAEKELDVLHRRLSNPTRVLPQHIRDEYLGSIAYLEQYVGDVAIDEENAAQTV